MRKRRSQAEIIADLEAEIDTKKEKLKALKEQAAKAEKARREKATKALVAELLTSGLSIDEIREKLGR